MIPVDDGNCLLFLRMLGDCFKSRQRLEAEILVLRHQLNVLQQRAPRRVHLQWASRALFIWLYRCCPRILDAITIVRPETVVRWHRMAFAAYWRWKSRSPGGRPRIGKEVRDLIRRMSFENRRPSGLRGKSPRRFPGTAPKYLIRDNDRAFAGVFKARVRANRPTSFRAPWQNGYIERLIGSIRRECTDHLIVVNAEHLREFSRNMPAIKKCELTFRAGGRALHSSDRAVRRYYCASGPWWAPRSIRTNLSFRKRQRLWLTKRMVRSQVTHLEI